MVSLGAATLSKTNLKMQVPVDPGRARGVSSRKAGLSGAGGGRAKA